MKIDVENPDTPRPAVRSTGKVFDVMRPGRTPASPTSRPVVMSLRSDAQQAQTAVSGIGQRSTPAAAQKPAPPEVNAAEAPPAQLSAAEKAIQPPAPDLAVPSAAAEPEITPNLPLASAASVKPLSSDEIAAANAEQAVAPELTTPITLARPKIGAVKMTLCIVGIIAVLIIVFDVLLDSGILAIHMPHTHFFGG